MGLNGARIGIGIVVNDFQNSLPFVTDQIMSFKSIGTTLFDPSTFDFFLSSGDAVSKKSFNASCKFFLASATVSPWLVTSTSGHSAT